MKLYLCLLFSLFSGSLLAQYANTLLFPEYMDGIVFMRTHQKIRVPMNYDAANQRMMFYQQGNEMILTNVHMVDSIRIGEHFFIRFKNNFLERRIINNDTLLIEWKLEKVHIGYRGAYGQVSQVRSRSVNLYSISGVPHEAINTVTQTDLYKTKIKNTYYIFKNLKRIKYKKGSTKKKDSMLDNAIESIELECIQHYRY